MMVWWPQTSVLIVELTDFHIISASCKVTSGQQQEEHVVPAAYHDGEGEAALLCIFVLSPHAVLCCKDRPIGSRGSVWRSEHCVAYH